MSTQSQQEPEAPEYALSRKLIADLGGDALLGPLVYEHPWEKLAQCQALAVAASSRSVCIAVSPQLPEPVSDPAGQKAGMLDARLAVLVLFQRNVPGKGIGERVAGLNYALLNYLLRWDPSQTGIPYTEPRVTSVAPLVAADYKEFAEMSGIVLGVSISYNYKKAIRP